jgi:hypothetical protein
MKNEEGEDIYTFLFFCISKILEAHKVNMKKKKKPTH